MSKQNKLFENKMLKNKRGEDMLVDFWAILVFAIIILLFFILFSAKRSDTITNEISTEFANKDAEYMLNSFLRSPAIGFNSQKTVADIIIEDYVNDDYARTEQLFENYYKYTKGFNGYKVNDVYIDINGHDIKIIMPDGENAFGKIVKIIVEETVATATTTTQAATTKIPIGGLHEDYKSFSTKTNLPMYDKTIEIEFEISTWNYEFGY